MVCLFSPTPEVVVSELNRIIYKLLWKGTEKVTRLSAINGMHDQILNLIATSLVWDNSVSHHESVTENPRFFRFAPNVDSGMISSVANYRPFSRSFGLIPPRECFVKLGN